ncbi:MAG: VanZ family protein [Clostridia bacterium]|nr:VanZ family protein [Clostridia bacterium]
MERSKSQINIFNLISAVLIWILASVWFCIIFFLATETEFDSYIRSHNVIVFFKEVIGLELNQLIVRKFAHFFEYGFLSFAIYLGLSFTNGISPRHAYKFDQRKSIKHVNELCIIYAFWLATFISIVDEYIQLFVEGRFASIIDILIDSGSIVLSLLIVRICFLLKLMILHKNEDEYDNY